MSICVCVSRRPPVAGRDFPKDALAVTTPDKHEQNMKRNGKTSTHTNTKHTSKKEHMNDKSMRRRRSRRWRITRVSRKRIMQDIQKARTMTSICISSRDKDYESGEEQRQERTVSRITTKQTKATRRNRAPRRTITITFQ